LLANKNRTAILTYPCSPSYRPDIDLSTAIYSRSTPLYQQRIGSLEQELREIEEENANLSLQLEQTMTTEESLRSDANEALQRLDQVSRLV
jgi:septal ring factor EnvC (AmiA/AmiB activator)